MRRNERFVFLGTPRLAVLVLEELETAGLLPTLVVTTPDERAGRGLKLTPPPVKAWAEERGIEVLQPERPADITASLRASGCEAFVVVAYGKLLPPEVLAIPKQGALNVHPSLLPRLRGASPVRSAILNDEKNVGVTVMQLDEEMDHGPIIAQKKVETEWPPRASALEEILMREGGRLLATVLPPWLAGTIEARPQNHDVATYCEKMEKGDALLDLNADAYHNLLKIRAYEGWPAAFAYFQRNGKKIRVQILDATIVNGALVITRVKPEGKKEMSYEDFLNSGARPLA